MIESERRLAPPTDDRRWKAVTATMRKYGFSASALIETLHSMQENFGYVDEDGLKYVAEALNVPPSKVFGVATFYNLFSMEPTGRHKFSLCVGTTCYVKGSDQILEFMKEEYALEPGQTTPDGELTFESARCVGACGLAPVMILDGEIVGKLTIDEMKLRIREWMAK